jgi:hypothetical protein
VSDRILTPIIAVGLAFLIWLYFRSRDQEVLDDRIPVQLQVAAVQEPEYQVEHNAHPLKVSFTGPPTRIKEVRSKLHQEALSLKRTISVPPDHRNDASYEETLHFDPGEVQGQLPPGVRVVIAENQTPVVVHWRKLAEKQLPVVPTFDAHARDRVEHWVCEPPTVVVRGPREVLDQAVNLTTVICPVPEISDATEVGGNIKSQNAELVKSIGKQPVAVSLSEVTVRLTLKPAQKTYELVDVPVHFLCPAGFPYRPQFTTARPAVVSFKVKGPSLPQRPDVSAFVDLTVRKFGAGLHADEPIQLKLPKDYLLVGEPPRLSSFKLEPVNSATAAVPMQ